MKIKTTQKEIKANTTAIIAIPYCHVQRLLRYHTPTAYTVRREGWASDVYIINGVAISTGYAPFGNIRPDYETIRQYEAAADNAFGVDDVDTILAQFIQEVTK